MVCAEYAPLAKTGGLADAVAGLSAALAEKGHDVRVVMPDYGVSLPPGFTASPSRRIGNLTVDTVTAKTPGGVPVYRIGCREIGTGGQIYAGDALDAPRFWAFNRAVPEALAALDWRPEIVHCHDWHAALVPALASVADSPLNGVRSVLTLHNVGYQGAFGRDLLPADAASFFAAIDDEHSRARDYVVFLEAGIRFADRVTTVSPTYAREISSPEHGMGLDGLLRARGEDFVGILNGIDYRFWSPESDPFITPRYATGDAAGKARVKAALAAELGLSNDAPILGAVSRLVEQKGIDLLVGALPALLERTRARFAILGSGDTDLESALTAAAKAHPERVAFRCGYDEGLAHRIIAGSDLLVVPSRYEPCGLTQLYAMRYGTVPVVRKTGGLADTVTHYAPDTGEGTGSVFEHADAQGLIWGVTTALEWYASPDEWRRVQRNGERLDFSWNRQAEPYAALYQRLAEHRVNQRT